ncbi:hypothetical protein Cantr_10730 [Candida viswanathii]|uniref:Uncharacterized protein n=1 Tax=Candida viswanathii TaxID=5486 RepID=A0A367YD69_9ASCO|nr:hypothetical protein Cantr_10730 [Candida viswanathii]
MDPTIHQELSDECGTLLLLHQLAQDQSERPTWHKYLTLTVRTLRKLLRLLNVLSNLIVYDIADTEQLGELGCVIIKIGQMAHTGFSSKHDLPQNLALGYTWLSSLSRINDLIKEIPHVKKAREGRSLETVLEEEGTGEIEYGRYSSSTIQLLSQPKVDLLNLQSRDTFLTKNPHPTIIPLGSSSQIQIVELPKDYKNGHVSLLAKSPKTQQFLYIPPASLSNTVSDKKIQEYITTKNIKGARRPAFFVTLESWREFKKVLPLIFCVLAETPAFNKVTTKPFHKEIMYQGDLVKSLDDVIVNTFNKSGIKSQCDNVLLRFNMYKGAVSANTGKNIPGMICEHIWNTYVDYFKKHRVLVESDRSEGVEFGSMLLHEVVRWHIKRCNLVRDELDTLRQEVNEYCDAFEKKVKEVDDRERTSGEANPGLAEFFRGVQSGQIRPILQSDGGMILVGDFRTSSLPSQQQEPQKLEGEDEEGIKKRREEEEAREQREERERQRVEELKKKREERERQRQQQEAEEALRRNEEAVRKLKSFEMLGGFNFGPEMMRKIDENERRRDEERERKGREERERKQREERERKAREERAQEERERKAQEERARRLKDELDKKLETRQGKQGQTLFKDYNQFIKMDLTEEISKLEANFKAAKKAADSTNTLDTKEILDYVKSHKYEIMESPVRVSQSQWDDVLLPYLNEVLNEIGADPNYTVDDFDAGVGEDEILGPEKRDEIAWRFVQHRKTTMLKALSRNTINTLFELVTDRITDSTGMLSPPGSLDLNLFYETSLEFFSWVILREKETHKRLRDQEQELIERLVRDEKKVRDNVLESVTVKKRSIEIDFEPRKKPRR